MMTYDLNDKVVLITGAAGGIGAAATKPVIRKTIQRCLNHSTEQGE
jgi:NAD(P)-dependent dehydrogenase (short-subunit alcohol dehydrogenase family)